MRTAQHNKNTGYVPGMNSGALPVNVYLRRQKTRLDNISYVREGGQLHFYRPGFQSGYKPCVTSVNKKTFSQWAALLGLASLGIAPAFGQAQQVPIPEQPSVAPQIEIAGTGIGTLDLGRSRNALPDGGRASGSQINISDSAISIGAAQRLYKGGIGSLNIGGLALDQTNVGRGTQLFLHQAYVDYQTQNLESYLGRTDNPTAQIVTFPTLRGDDLITFTNLLDPFSSGENVEEHRYSNVGSVTLNQKLTTFENFHVQHLIDSAGDKYAERHGPELVWGQCPIPGAAGNGGDSKSRFLWRGL